MRIATLGIYHEANTYSPIAADLELFNEGGVYRDGEIIDKFASSHATIGGFIQASSELGFELVPLLFGRVNPVGPITRDAFEQLSTEMVDRLAADGPWDGILLALHGAAVAEHVPDADGELARMVRATVGPDVPVGAVLDMHANVSQQLIDALTITLVYQTNPHVDAAERAVDCARLLVRAIREEVRPVQALRQLPLVVNIARQTTDEEPMAGLVATAAAIKNRPGMLSASVVEGFPYADVSHMGMSCISIHDGDPRAAAAAADELADEIWSCRGELQGEGHDVRAALDLARNADAGPVVLLDVGDNVGGGAPGDSTVILAVAQQVGVRSLLQTLWDPEAVAECVDAGEGAEVALEVGARHPHSAGQPVRVEAVVRRLADGRFEEPRPTHGGFRFFDMGPTAVLDTSDGHTLVVMSKQTANTSLQQYRSLGIDVRDYRVVVAKGCNAPRAAYAPVAQKLVTVDTPGIAAMNLGAFEYLHRRRPMYPFEDQVVYRNR
ncbi:M81 family metallopeptidase [Amycolatopsis tucumanensis]|uniref:M81 family metallopeptidase n=1 Tax=Amycolatopsis tucumanensis TaxID=401106 RepID=A0ABP7I2Z1_9PSEU|nr:M81 family metallopeptidase [Amycolatopsis tucumanensis]MCF6426190.1 M81 family metallopeptidase [Amycolatopsis tucumanensis]